MAPIHKYRNDDGDLEEVELIETLGWAYKEASEEGESASVTITVPDPDMTLSFVPWRRWITYEDESESDDNVLFSGFVSSYELGRTGGDDQEPLGRVWTLNLVDMNTLWGQRVLVGSDTKRPAETDVERMTWLVGTEEMGYFDDISLIAAGDPVNMDKRDTRGTTPKDVADDAAQQASKNYWIAATIDGIFVWYGKDENNSYLSPLSLSNDPTDWTDAALADGSSTVWPLSYDAKLSGSGERIYSGAYVEYEKGAVYRRNTATMDFFTLSGRDIAHPAPEIKTKTKAIARANALVNRLNEVLLRVTATVELPAAKATMLKTGMLVDIKATHWPTFEVGRSCRIVNATAAPAGSGNKYRVSIEAVPVGESAGTGTFAVLFSKDDTVLEILPDNMTALVEYNPGPAKGYIAFASGPVRTGDVVWTHAESGTNWNELVAVTFSDVGTPDTPVTAYDPTFSTTASITVTTTGAGIILAAVRIFNFDSGARTLSKSAGFVTIYERMNAAGASDRDWGAVNLGYLPVSGAGTYTITWTMSNQFNWEKVMAAVFIPSTGSTAVVVSGTSGISLNDTVTATL